MILSEYFVREIVKRSPVFYGIGIFAPGLGSPRDNGKEYLEGPHYPQPHKWYAEVDVKDGFITKVK